MVNHAAMQKCVYPAGGTSQASNEFPRMQRIVLYREEAYTDGRFCCVFRYRGMIPESMDAAPNRPGSR